MSVVQADILSRFVPALSATSDAPVAVDAVQTPATSATSADPIVAPAAPVEKEVKTEAEVKVDAPEGGETKTEAAADPAPAAPKPKKGIGERFSEITQQRDEATKALEATTEQLRAADERLNKAREAMEKLAAVAEDATDARPNRESFDTPEAYETALIEYSIRRGQSIATRQAEAKRAAVELAAAEQTAAEARDAEQTATRQRAETVAKEWGDRRGKFAAEYPDYETVAEADDLPISPAMAAAIIAEDNGPAIAYHLGQNKDLAARLAGLDATRAAIEIGKISATLTAPPKISRAPAPIEPLGSRAAATTKTADEESMEEYAARRQRELKAAH